MQPITKATNLTNSEYQHLLNVAKGLRKLFLHSAKCRSWRVYTEARKNGLRSKMCLRRCSINDINYGMKIIKQINDNLYPDLDIVIERNNNPNNYPGALNDVCIFVKYKQ